MRTFFTLAFLTTVLVGTTTAADPPAPTAKAYSLSIVRIPKDTPSIVTGTGGPQTAVGIAFTIPDRDIIGLDPKACKLTFTDDKGTDLSIPDRPLIASPAVRLDLKRTQAGFSIYVPKVPAEGATKLRVKGTLVVLCGTGEKTATADSLTIKAMEKATAGPAAFEVTQTNKTLFVRVTAEEPALKTIMLLDADKKLVGQIVPFLLVNPKGKIIQNGLNTPPANNQAVGIKVIYYEKVESVTVPIDTEIGVGG